MMLLDCFNYLAVFVIDDAFYIVMAVLAAASTAISVDASNDAAKAQEQQGLLAADAAKKAARNEFLQNEENLKRERDNKKRRLARVRSGMIGGSGMVMDGSMEDAFVETAGRMELEIQDAARAGSMQVQGIRDQGALSLWEARTAAVASRVEASGSLLSGIGKTAGYAAKVTP
jgi:hypothetical protein